VTFNGSQSTDDRTSSSRLHYRWDFDSDGRTDATGATVRHRFQHKGRHRVRLTVVDGNGAKSSKTVTVKVRGRSAAGAAAAAQRQRMSTLSPTWR
jgi:PKD repeat protein